jgi:AcrR family transcriptional regulator
MPKIDGYLTREKILNVAEKLFSELGYDAASIGTISKLAGINKATIYYHFKDKQSILHTLYFDMIEQMKNRLIPIEESESDLKVKIKRELDFLREKKDIVSILLMEAMKSNTDDDSLFQIAATEINNEKSRFKDLKHSQDKKDLFLIHEFFTGFIPVLSFVVLEEKYRNFFHMSEEKAIETFTEAIIRSHHNTHIK